MLFFVNCVHSYKTPTRIDAEHNHYGWWEDIWLRSVYSGNGRKYEAIIQKTYNRATASVAKVKAVEHKRIRRTVDFVFKNQDITHRNIGVVYRGFAAWTTNLDYRIVEAPSALRGAILVDNGSVELKRGTFFKEENVSKINTYLDKLKASSSTGLLSVLPRRDLKIFLFVYSEDVSGLVSKTIARTPYKIILQNTRQSIELQGLEIKNYCEIPLSKIRQKFFFVIRKI